MTKPGTRPTPTAIKQLRGTTTTTESDSNFPTQTLLPKAPVTLNKYGKKLWNEYGEMFMNVGLLTAGDLIALEMLCSSYGRWVKAELDVAESGEVLVSDTGGVYQNPVLSVANRAYDNLKKMLAEFGLTPAERTRVTAMMANKKGGNLAEMLFQMKDD